MQGPTSIGSGRLNIGDGDVDPCRSRFSDGAMRPDACMALSCTLVQPIRFDFGSVPMRPDPPHIPSRSDFRFD
eukprot:3843563-Pyramimonas_sp.AAC.1